VRKVKRIRDQIADQIREEILSGKYREGDPLRETSLATRFNVSRGPIRDAILQLTYEGLLQAEPNKGARVARLWDEETRPIMVRMRLQIESFAVEKLVASADPKVFQSLQKNLNQLRFACEQQDLNSVVQFDMEFHRLLLQLCGLPNLESVWIPIMGGMRLQYSRHGKPSEVFEEHARIFDAIKKGDAAAALIALEQNISQS
jgi:DNA-binding GntR family transcriptional regulator